MNVDTDMGTSNEYFQPYVHKQRSSSSKLSSEADAYEEDSNAFESSEIQDDVFSLSTQSNTNIRASRFRFNKRYDLNKRSSSDWSDTELYDSTEGTNLDMFLVPSPNEETRQSTRDMSSPTSIASRSSTATFPGSRTGTPMMDQTLSAAFRDKIRNRLKSAKQKIKRKSFREELLEKQEQELNDEIETRLSSRSQWKKNLEKVLDSQIESLNEKKVSREEAYDFFVKTDWDVSEDSTKTNDKTIASITKVQKEGEEVIQVEEEDKRLLVRDMFSTTENWKIHERSKSLFKTRKERIMEEEKLLFIPSDKAVDDFNELQAAEDGIYVENSLSSKSLNKLKHRILSEGLKEKFLDESSAFIINEPVIKRSVSICPHFESDKELVSHFTPCRMEETFNISSNVKYELIVKVISLTFTSHPLFSEEHALSRQLVEYYNVYTSIIEENKIPAIYQKLKSLYMTAITLNSEALIDEIDVNRHERIEVNKRMLIKTYYERLEKTQKLRNILLQLLSTWDQLQKVREIQRYVTTNVKLVCIEDSNVNINKEKKLWNELVGEAIEVEKYILKHNDEKAQEEYRRDLRSWKQWQRTKRRMSSKLDSSEVSEEVEGTAEPIKPEPPVLTFDETKTIEKIRNNTLLLDGRLPGEPKFSKISLEINEINVRLKDLPKSEQKRRNELLKRKYSIQFVVNDKLCAQTNEKESNSNFSIFWNQIFNINVKNSSASLKFCVYEKQNLSANHLADIFVPLPDGLTNINNSMPLKLEFASDSSKHSIINGFLECMLYWEINSEGVLLCPSDLALNNKNYSELLKNLEILNVDDLKQWIQYLSTQDPNEPNNVTLINTIKNYKDLLESNVNFQKCFRLDPLMKEFDFVTDEDIENNPRFRLLQLRWQGMPSFKGYRFVPLNEKEIPMHLFDKKINAKTSLKTKKGFEDKREKAVKILTKVREQLIRQSRGTFDRPRTLEDMVIEEDVPSIRL